ncbi:uncharacterized protein [Amphiura filiformis]|uniref:uncharacterized protein isoform X2 n=1 Tax=Amphiura filiformis TaxID=82378 RepID=UPI003B2222CF
MWRVPDVMTAYQEDTMLKKTVFTRNISKMFPVVFFRLLLNSRVTELQHVSLSSPFIHTLLTMYSSLVELHCQAGLEADEQQHNTQYAMPLSLEFHLSCNKFLHNYITRCPVSLLQNLDQSVMHLCDEDITTLIRQRLRNM